MRGGHDGKTRHATRAHACVYVSGNDRLAASLKNKLIAKHEFYQRAEAAEQESTYVVVFVHRRKHSSHTHVCTFVVARVINFVAFSVTGHMYKIVVFFIRANA